MAKKPVHARAPKRAETFNLRLSFEDRERLDKLIAYYEAPAAAVIRQLIKERIAVLDHSARRTM